MDCVSGDAVDVIAGVQNEGTEARLISRAKVRVRACFHAKDPEQDHCSPAQAVGEDNVTRECELLQNLFIRRTSELHPLLREGTRRVIVS